MKILIENGAYDCHNAGDLSMLSVCISRLQQAFPQAVLYTVSESPEKLKMLIPQARPVRMLKAKASWLQERNLFGGLHKLIPIADTRIDDFESRLRRQYPKISKKLVLNNIDSVGKTALKAYFSVLKRLDFAVVCGGGFITDAFETHALRLLETIYCIIKSGKPVAFFGQGIGPINSPKLKRLAAAVFPKAELIALREDQKGVTLLKQLGVSEDRIVVTGDDAIELAAEGRKPHLGQSLGFNIRIANYAKIGNQVSSLVFGALTEFAQSNHTDILPIPISWHEDENDLTNTMNFMGKVRDPSNDALESIPGLSEQISKCRVVITGSYHAAVFALSQGIPVIAIANSEYYVDKFCGLAAMFRPGMHVCLTSQSDWLAEFKDHLVSFWKNAPMLRLGLQAHADAQIIASQNAYQRFFRLIKAQH